MTSLSHRSDDRNGPRDHGVHRSRLSRRTGEEYEGEIGELEKQRENQGWQVPRLSNRTVWLDFAAPPASHAEEATAAEEIPP